MQICTAVNGFCCDHSGNSYSGVISCSHGTECLSQRVDFYLPIRSDRESLVQLHFSHFHFGREIADSGASKCVQEEGSLVVEQKGQEGPYFCGNWTGEYFRCKVQHPISLSVRRPASPIADSFYLTYSGKAWLYLQGHRSFSAHVCHLSVCQVPDGMTVRETSRNESAIYYSIDCLPGRQSQTEVTCVEGHWSPSPYLSSK